MNIEHLEVLWAAKYDYRTGWGIKRHQHDYYQIIYVTSGIGKFVLENELFTVEKDMFLFIKPSEYHELEKMQKSELKVLEIKFRVNNEVLSKELKLIFGAFRNEDGSVKLNLERIREEGKAKKPFYKEMTADYLNLILLTILREGKLAGDKNSEKTGEIAGDFTGIAKIVADYIDKHYMNNIKLEALSSTIGYNKNYLCQAFKEKSGWTMGDYLYLTRVQKAKELIIYSDYDLKDISDKVGFQNIHHFNRVFKKVFGVPPGQFRRTEQEELCKDIFIDEKFVNPTQIDT